MAIPKVILDIETARETDRRFLTGIAAYSAQCGPWEFYLKPLPYLTDKTPKNKLWFQNLDADGIITRPMEDIENIRKMNIPIVASSIYKETYPNIPSTSTDSVAIAEMAAEHLLNCGLWNFAYCGFKDIYWSDIRCQSFKQKIAGAGFTTHELKSTRESQSWKKQKPLLVEWLISLPKPVGIMACNDDRALQIIEACKVAELKIPEQIAVIGVDNDELVCNLNSPNLSSISVNFQRGGFEAAKTLDKLISGKKPKNNTIHIEPTHIVTRQSTDILTIKDIEVANAIRFIRQHSRESIQVDDVVDATALSRRVLEKKFRKFLHRSLNEEIRRLRVNHIAQMLIETNLSVSQIASVMNYTDSEHISRYFKNEKGLTPLAYRRKYSKEG